MSDERDTIAVIAEHLALALDPLSHAVSSEENFIDFLEELGWDFSSIPSTLNSLKAPAQQTSDLVSSGNQPSGDEISALLDAVRVAFDTVSNIETLSGLPADFKNEFPGQLVEYLVAEYLLEHQPGIGYLLAAIGILREEEVEATGSRLAYLKRSFAFKDFNDFFQDPLVFFTNAYQWGTSDFEGEKMILIFHRLLEAWGFDAYEEGLDPDTLSQLAAGALTPTEAFDTSLNLILYQDDVSPADFRTGVGLFILPETASNKPGFALLPFASVQIEESFHITEFLELAFEGGLDLTGGLGILIRPNKDVEFMIGFGPGTPSAVSGNLGITLTLGQDEPTIIVGSPDASRLEFDKVSIKGGTRFHSGGKFEVMTEFHIQKGSIAIKPGEGEADGFLASVLPADGMKINFDLGVGFSTEQGFYFAGSSGLEIQLPVHINLGILEIQGAMIAMKPKVEPGKPLTIPLEMAATFKTDFAVLKGVVENFGFKLDFKFPDDQNGNLGPLDLSFGLRPPNGIGLSVDAGVVKGGGYLFFDFDKEEYAGALELVFSGFLTLKAIGLVTTKMPDGSKGFSLLVIITAEFTVQLGFGFTLLGVGGLLGLNRTVRLEPLAEGVRTGSVTRIMFPTNVVENAPRIISDLRTYFPAEQDIFLIGPMAKLGWGTPTLISLSLGIIIEIPGGNIVILGVLKVALPDEAAALLVLQVSFIGALEWDKKRAWFFASMYDSRVLFITLEGEMGVLIGWGSDSAFVVSVGGFHPSFNPPPMPFPVPKRISLNILNESWAKIQVQGYFAVTSNTVQFGAKVTVYLGVSAFNIDGHLAFDALFQFSPFYFIIEISASLSVKVFGIGLFSVRMRGSLEGPTPWRIKGTGAITLLFWDIEVDFDETWGESADTSLPPIEVMPILLDEIEKAENWVAEVPSSNNLLVSLRKIDEAEGLVLHPVGSLQVSQKAVPLNLTLDKLGNQKPSDANKFSLSVNAGGLEKTKDVSESFAMAQYQEMTKAEKLSRPSFEPEPGGLELSIEDNAFKSGKAVKRIVRYETIIIDKMHERFVVNLMAFIILLFNFFMKRNAASLAAVSEAIKRQKQPHKETIKVKPNTYTVAYNSNNTVYSSELRSFESEALAREFMNKEVKKNPNLATEIHVIPDQDINTAA